MIQISQADRSGAYTWIKVTQALPQNTELVYVQAEEVLTEPTTVKANKFVGYASYTKDLGWIMVDPPSCLKKRVVAWQPINTRDFAAVKSGLSMFPQPRGQR